MMPVDWAIVAVVALSVLLGLIRGLMRELLSLAGWIGGVLLALHYASTLGSQLPFDLWPQAKTAIAALAIVIGCVSASVLVAWVARQMLKAVKLSGVDRVFGGLFGFARACFIIGLAVLMTRGTTVVKQPLWTESLLLPHVGRAVEAAVRWMAPVLPMSMLVSPPPAPLASAAGHAGVLALPG